MGKKIVVITGSPRKDGNSNAMAGAFVEAAKAKGHIVVRFDAAEKHVEGCKACDKCFNNEKACFYDDDFNTIAPELEAADAIVFTMPLYWFSFPAQIKAVIDKMYSFSYSGKDISGKECGLIICCEDRDVTAMDGAVKTYELMADYLKWKSVGTVLVPGVYNPGDIEKTDGISKAAGLAGKF